MTGSSNQPWGAGLSQNDLMLKDTVLVLNDNDDVVGSASKKDSHVFCSNQPTGILHRAFSVFIFDTSDGSMLLQQRAASKITFPNVWTNTCCSHPLHGMTPSEVDTPQDVQKGTVMGVKHAAVRKLGHELGIPASQLDPKKFKFLTRLHYWAADTVTHGKKAPWGEHEIDYVLFYTVGSKDELTIQPHPDEVDDYKWVTPKQLQTMLDDKTLLFSPWFRLILQRWVWTWWKDLDACMMTDKYCDFTNIHRFDPPPEHLGGAGNAKPKFADAGKKQGAYGLVPVHKESTWSQLSHLDEVFSAFTYLYLKPLQSNLQSTFIERKFDQTALAFCNDILVKVSRSFAAVIQQLPANVLVDILVFYLVLRALDTIEDDTRAFPSHRVKINHLQSFHKNALGDPSWTMTGVGAGDERLLLEQFPRCHKIFAALEPPSREIIVDITKRMANGMAEFVGKDLGQGTVDIEQYNRYCHFVAGLVGEGLSRLFAASGLENPNFGSELFLSDQMGLFLQKTNIIRDYLEDYVDKRAFWPQTVWKKYSKSGDLGYFAQQDNPEAADSSLHCLNELVTDALELVPDCLTYMDKLECSEIFRFCAIPQVMAIATLDKCFSNPKVFTGVVKIRKGTSCKLILRTNNIPEVHDTFHLFAQSILDKAKREHKRGFVDPSFDRTVHACEKIMALTSAQATSLRRRRWARRSIVAGLVSASAYSAIMDRNWKLAGALLGTAALTRLYGPWSVPSNLKPASAIKPLGEVQQV